MWFPKEHSNTEYTVVSCENLLTLEKWTRSVDIRKVFGALLTDLSKASACFDHELLIPKLNICGFSFPALKLIHEYLSNRKKGKLK